MPQLCSICISPDRETIDQELISGTPVRDIAGRHGLSKSSIDRHKKHIPVALLKAQEAVVVSNADTLLHQVKTLLEQAQSLTGTAQASGDLRTALQGIGKVKEILELLLRLAGEIDNNARIQVNVNSLLTTPEWAVMIRVLAKHPEINEELSTALKEAGL